MGLYELIGSQAFDSAPDLDSSQRSLVSRVMMVFEIEFSKEYFRLKLTI